jgi:hypothetical protein
MTGTASNASLVEKREKVEEASRSGREETQQRAKSSGLRGRKAGPNPHTTLRCGKLALPLGLTAVFVVCLAEAAAADAQTSTTSTNLLLIDRFGKPILMSTNEVSAFAFGLTRSVAAGGAVRRSLASTLRSLAALSRVGLHGEASTTILRPARGWRWKVYQELRTTLRLNDESKVESGAGQAEVETERVVIGRVVAHAQAVFVALLALIHDRLNADLSSVAPALYARSQVLARGVLLLLEALANSIEGNEEMPSPDLPGLFAEHEAATRSAIPTLEPQLAVWLPGHLALYEDLIGRIADLERDALPPITDAPAPFARGATAGA